MAGDPIREDELPPSGEEVKQDNLFVRVADAVSWGMGTPTNISAWIIVVLIWFGLFGFGVVNTHTTFMPSWFTSNAFNFPLNTVTTLAELYIGFLVGAAANRNERAAEAQGERLEALERSIASLVQENTDLTKEIHGEVIPFVKEIHTQIRGGAK